MGFVWLLRSVRKFKKKNISLNLLRFILFQVLVCVSNFMSPNLVFTLSFPFSLCIFPSFSWPTNKRGHSLYLLVMNKKSKSECLFLFFSLIPANAKYAVMVLMDIEVGPCFCNLIFLNYFLRILLMMQNIRRDEIQLLPFWLNFLSNQTQTVME